jgi:hypothetical protein
MNNTLNNNSNKTIQAKQVKQGKFVPSLILMVPLSMLVLKELIPVPMLWIPSLIESTFYSRDLAMSIAFSVVLTTIFVLPKMSCPKKRAPKTPLIHAIHPQHPGL